MQEQLRTGGISADLQLIQDQLRNQGISVPKPGQIQNLGGGSQNAAGYNYSIKAPGQESSINVPGQGDASLGTESEASLAGKGSRPGADSDTTLAGKGARPSSGNK